MDWLQVTVEVQLCYTLIHIFLWAQLQQRWAPSSSKEVCHNRVYYVVSVAYVNDSIVQALVFQTHFQPGTEEKCIMEENMKSENLS